MLTLRGLHSCRGQGFRGRGRMHMNGDMHARHPQMRPIPKEDFDIQGALERFKKDDLAQVDILTRAFSCCRTPFLHRATLHCEMNAVHTFRAGLS